MVPPSHLHPRRCFVLLSVRAQSYMEWYSAIRKTFHWARSLSTRQRPAQQTALAEAYQESRAMRTRT